MIDIDDVTKGLTGDEGALTILGRQYFEKMYYKDIQTDSYRKILRYMAESETEWVLRQSIIGGAGPSDKVVDNGIKALKRNGLIFSKRGKPGEYRLSTRAFSLWIKIHGN